MSYFIKIPDGATTVYTYNYWLQDPKNSSCHVAFYGADKTFILRGSGAVSYSVPNGATYIRLSYRHELAHDRQWAGFNPYETFAYGKLRTQDAVTQESQIAALSEAVSETQNTLITTVGKSLRFCVIGDIHCGTAALGSYEGTWRKPEFSGATNEERMQLLVDTIMDAHREKPFNFIMCAGDMSAEHNQDLEHFNDPDRLKLFTDLVMSKLPAPFFTCPGNHDPYSEVDFFRYMGTPRQYSFETPDFYFIMLDTYANITNPHVAGSIYAVDYTGVDTDFLKAELAKADGKSVVLVAHFIDPAVAGFADIVKAHPEIKLLITAHSHYYGFVDAAPWAAPTTLKRLVANNFCYPGTTWETVESDSGKQHLWSINVVEINDAGTALETYYIQPAHNYTGIGLDWPGAVGETHKILDVQKKKHAMFQVGNYDKAIADLRLETMALREKIENLEEQE